MRTSVLEGMNGLTELMHHPDCNRNRNINLRLNKLPLGQSLLVLLERHVTIGTSLGKVGFGLNLLTVCAQLEPFFTACRD